MTGEMRDYFSVLFLRAYYVANFILRMLRLFMIVVVFIC